MNTQILIVLNLVLVSRVMYLYEDKALSARKQWTMAAIQLAAALFFFLDYRALIFYAALLLANYLVYRIEQKAKNTDLVRMVSLLAYLLVVPPVVLHLAHLQFSAQAVAALGSLSEQGSVVAFIQSTGVDRFNLTLLGLLLIANEPNIWIRLFFSKFSIHPPKNQKIDKGTLLSSLSTHNNAGRIIGVLERIITYLLVLQGSIGTLGFVIAAKTFARFKELEDRTSAEYVLIGTLISILIAVAIALIVKEYIQYLTL